MADGSRRKVDAPCHVLPYRSNLDSIEYVTRVTSGLPSNALRLSTAVDSVSPITMNGRGKVILRTVAGHTETYDRVILACHSRTASNILANGNSLTTEERVILKGFQWSQNEIVLHSDVKVGESATTVWWGCFMTFPRPCPATKMPGLPGTMSLAPNLHRKGNLHAPIAIDLRCE